MLLARGLTQGKILMLGDGIFTHFKHGLCKMGENLNALYLLRIEIWHFFIYSGTEIQLPGDKCYGKICLSASKKSQVGQVGIGIPHPCSKFIFNPKTAVIPLTAYQVTGLKIYTCLLVFMSSLWVRMSENCYWLALLD